MRSKSYSVELRKIEDRQEKRVTLTIDFQIKRHAHLDLVKNVLDPVISSCYLLQAHWHICGHFIKRDFYHKTLLFERFSHKCLSVI